MRDLRPGRGPGLGLIQAVLISAIAALGTPAAPATAAPPAGGAPRPCRAADPAPLPVLPADPGVAPADYERQLYRFLLERRYASWPRDKRIRDTGPMIDGAYYGTHPAVRIYYHPDVVAWLERGREGCIPQGAMIIKEMFPVAGPPRPAAYWNLQSAATLDANRMWTVMVRDSRGALDGWYWAGLFPDHTKTIDEQIAAAVDKGGYPFPYPDAGFGQDCMRCHASAETAMTFSALRNIEGKPGDPVLYRVDDSWRGSLTPAAEGGTAGEAPHAEKAEPPAMLDSHSARAVDPDVAELVAELPARDLHADFVDYFDQRGPVDRDEVVPIPDVNHDRVVSSASGPGQFITSDQCLACHGGLAGPPLGPNMYLPAHDPDEQGINLSPYGEWRWSMMGLAGRDPIFYAQLESELAIHPASDEQPDLGNVIQDLCLHCHGVMGQRQFKVDHGVAQTPGGSQPFFDLERVMAAGAHGGQDAQGDAKYGALARDGISCMVCHQIVDDGPVERIHQFTGDFRVSNPIPGPGGGTTTSRVWGPFPRAAGEPPIAVHPMEQSLGITPEASTYVTSSQLCGNCHTIYLPVLDRGKPVLGPDGKPKFHFEQATYLEWQNSAFRDDGGEPRSCQDCHMTDHYRGRPLSFRIASIQDETYPESDHLAPVADITAPIRDGFRRHSLAGINLFALEMFRQFDDVLGVRQQDYMTGNHDLPFAIATVAELAREETAEVALEAVTATREGDRVRLEAEVVVTSKVGHRFPSGVGFRRAFLEFRVLDARREVVWASGRTNELGVIVDGEGEPLPSESFAELPGCQPTPLTCLEEEPPAPCQAYQEHWRRIDRQDRVQIYQELSLDPQHRLTSSFLSICQVVKDNRLLPKGWTAEGPPGFEYAEVTRPEGQAEHDPDFVGGSDRVAYAATVPAKELALGGSVEVRLFYQSIPPPYLADRFRTARGENGARLYYLASHLELEETAGEDWKLEVGEDCVKVDAGLRAGGECGEKEGKRR